MAPPLLFMVADLEIIPIQTGERFMTYVLKLPSKDYRKHLTDGAEKAHHAFLSMHRPVARSAGPEAQTPAMEPPVPSPNKTRMFVEHPADQKLKDKVLKLGASTAAKEKQDLANKELANLAIDSIYEKMNLAKHESDPMKRIQLYADAQILMGEFLNVGRDPSCPESRRDAIRITLKAFLQDVKLYAPNAPDLTHMYDTHRTPEQSAGELERLIKSDPALKGVYENWAARQKAPAASLPPGL